MTENSRFLPSGTNGDGQDKDDSISFLENSEYIFRDPNNDPSRPDDTQINRQKLLFDDEDVFRNMAATMRNPEINKHNILDTLGLSDYKVFNTKR
jgi:hypothetical protein